MARSMGVEQEWHRTVITKTWAPCERYPEGLVDTYVRGPYRQAAQARAALTRAQRGSEDLYRRSYRPGPAVTGRVERSATTWTTLED